MRYGTALINPLLYTLLKEDFKTVLKSYFLKRSTELLGQNSLEKSGQLLYVCM